MSIHDDIAADQIAVDVATAKLAEDQAKLAVLEPHLSLLARLEEGLSTISNDFSEAISSIRNKLLG